jgi:hypothetical protein
LELESVLVLVSGLGLGSVLGVGLELASESTLAECAESASVLEPALASELESELALALVLEQAQEKAQASHPNPHPPCRRYSPPDRCRHRCPRRRTRTRPRRPSEAGNRASC